MQVKRIFLLGGHDLEMEEIKNILQSAGENYIDKQLAWGAQLSDYKEYLNFDGTIYGVELQEDIVAPKNYSEVDHHGKNDYKPSSLEQVVQILNLKLTKQQKLIAANDSRYISGMKKLCATQKEIDEIRQLDRESQGITKYDEKLARQSFIISNGNIMYSITPHFSATSDIAYYKYDNYIIYNYSKVMFYGYKKDLILKFLDSLNIKEEMYYYGGGEFGFVGIKESALEKEQIKTVLEEFKKLQEKKNETISHHIFMLPFTYTDKKKVLKNFKGNKFEEVTSYNEQAYFHKFFINSMFKNCEIYENKDFKHFTIKKSQEYILNVEKLSLRIFDDFKVGILSFHLENRSYKETQEILEINDYGRRIYPEYLDEDNSCNVVAEYIKLDGISEDFKSKNRDNTPKISQIITHLVGDIQAAVDDRMFTISYFNNPKFVNETKENYLCHDKWYEYVFVDGDGKTVQSQSMQEALIQKATYDRWRDYGTLYGMSKYSFVCLAENDFPLNHMKTLYFSMFSLLLMVRATLLKFADDVSSIAKDIGTKDIASQVNDVYKNYIKFINKYYFREITAKDQGLELYEKALDILKVERDVKDLDREIAELFKYVELQSEKKSAEENKKINKKLEKIQLIGGVFLGASVLTGFFGMNVGNTDNSFSWWFVIPILSIATWYGYKKFYKGEL